MTGKMYLLVGAVFILKCFSVCCHLSLSICPVGKVLITHENNDLNLTCKVTSDIKLNERFDLSWKLPSKRKDKISISITNSANTLLIQNLKESDSGQYICELNYLGNTRTKKITVYIKSKKCVHPFFDCGNNICIPKHYVCDGYMDCPNGYDESFTHCGPDACHGKFMCDGRCIPKENCCDVNIDDNCTVSYVMPCCHKVLTPPKIISSGCISSDECRYSQMFGSSSMLYIVASCATAVMLVSSLFLIIVCRICTRNPEEIQRWPLSPNSLHQCSSMVNDMDDRDASFLPEEGCPLDDSMNFTVPPHLYREADQSDDFVLLNFVPGYGFEVADCRPKPPPYTERTLGIPPPPYSSMVDVTNEAGTEIPVTDNPATVPTNEGANS